MKSFVASRILRISPQRNPNVNCKIEIKLLVVVQKIWMEASSNNGVLLWVGSILIRKNIGAHDKACCEGWFNAKVFSINPIARLQSSVLLKTLISKESQSTGVQGCWSTSVFWNLPQISDTKKKNKRLATNSSCGGWINTNVFVDSSQKRESTDSTTGLIDQTEPILLLLEAGLVCPAKWIVI